MLSILRSPVGSRAPVDPGLAGGLRAWLEDAAVVDGSAPSPIVVGCRRSDGAASTAPRILQALVAAVFRLTVTSGPPDDPFRAALSAVSVDEDEAGVVESVRAMSRGDRAALRAAVAAQAGSVARQWRPVPPGWLPRTRDRLAAPLAGGRIVLVGRADLVLGAPSEGRASVCLVDVVSGIPSRARVEQRRRLALLETVRSGAPPFRVATYYPALGRLDADAVTGGLLAGAAARACADVDRAIREVVVAAGGPCAVVGGLEGVEGAEVGNLAVVGGPQ